MATSVANDTVAIATLGLHKTASVANDTVAIATLGLHKIASGDMYAVLNIDRRRDMKLKIEDDICLVGSLERQVNYVLDID